MTHEPIASHTRRVTPQRAALLVVMVLDMLAALLVLQQIAADQNYPFDSDEALHATNSLELALDLRAGDWGAFVRHSYRQAWYPPVFYWMEAIAFLIFGATPLVARLVSWVCLILAVPAIYAVGVELDEKRGWLIGLIAAVLTMTSQPVMDYAGLVMLELPGVLVSFVTLWLYLRAARQPTTRRWLLASLSMIVTFLTKYPYGIAVTGAIGLAELLQLFPLRAAAGWKAIMRRWLLLFGPLAIALIVWFAGPDKLSGLISYAEAAQQETLLSEENLIFYPRSLVYHYSPAPIFAPLLLVAFLWSLTRWRDSRLRLIVLYFVIGLVMMTVKLLNQPRYFATIAPAIHLLVGGFFAWLVARWPSDLQTRRLRLLKMGAVIGVAVCVIGSVPNLIDRIAVFPALMRAEYETDPRATELAGWIATQLPAGERAYVINPWDQFSTLQLQWYLAIHSAAPDARLVQFYLPSIDLSGSAAEKAGEVLTHIRESGARYVIALEGGREGEQTWPDYEHAMGDALKPIGQRAFNFDYFDLTRYFKRNLITTVGLEDAMQHRSRPIVGRVTVYQLTQP